MAELRVEGGDLVVHLRPVEKVVGFHGDVRVPLSSVASVHPLDKPWLELRGRRMAGTAMRGVVATGTWIHGDRLFDFCVLRRLEPAVRVDLNTGRFVRLIVGVGPGGDPVSEAARIAAAAGIRPGSPA